MGTECITMHIDRADEITMSREPAGAARPGSALGLVTMPADRTPARGASFGAGEAQDASLFCFVTEIVDVLAVFPAGHALIMMASGISIAHAVRVADEERTDLVLDAEVNDLPGRLMPQIADAPLGPAAHLVFGALQFLPAAGMLLAPALLSGKLAKLPAALPFEGADTAPGDDQGGARIRRHGGEVDFAQVYRRLLLTRNFFRLGHLDADVQFKAPVPDQRTRTAIGGKVEGQDEGGSSSAHRQNHLPLPLVDGLSGPLDRVKLLGAPGILHAHLWMLFAQRASGIDVGEEGMSNLLDDLGIECEGALRCLFQVRAPWPAGMGHTRILVHFHAHVPDPRRFHLRLFEAAEECRREMSEAIDANCFHRTLFFFFARKAGMCHVAGKAGGVAFTPSPQRDGRSRSRL